jgi:hypothetical protein
MNLQDLKDEADQRQKLYRLKRLAWAREIGRPISQKPDVPEPGTLPTLEPEG